MILRKANEMTWSEFSECHDGQGTLLCKSLLDGFDTSKFALMHYDRMDAGVSIGEHTHTANDEAYFLLSGSGTLIFDGEEYEMNAGDISLCTIGHSHGYIAKTDSILIVVGSR